MPLDAARADRMSKIRPFYVMEVLERALRLQAEGKDVIQLQLGEPDFDTPRTISEAGIRALEHKHTRYVQAQGIPALRARIAAHYPEHCRPDLARVMVTPGSSAALQLAFACLLNPGDRVLLADPGYPCNINFIHLYGGIPEPIPCGPDSNYQLTADTVAAHWTDNTRAVLIASPSNPTGSVVAPDQIGRIADAVRQRGGRLIVDEIYHGLTYDTAVQTALCDGDDLFVINSFSKYYGMTGWRLGWMVVPDAYIDDITRLSQNLFISASTPAQYAALRAFDDDTITELERRRALFQRRRDYFVPALRDLGFVIPRVPQGAFYAYADCSRFSDDSDSFALELLERALVGVAPGKDFGNHRQHEHVRFSYANAMDKLEQAVERMARLLT